MASPHTRGWTLPARQHSENGPGFPAHAGMDPPFLGWRAAWERLPRTRGDGPQGSGCGGDAEPASPHTRGWTRLTDPGQQARQGFPAHAGMDPSSRPSSAAGRRLPRTRGDGPGRSCRATRRRRASPHTRGWTPARCDRVRRRSGFPAHAGMDPRPGARPRPRAGLPRTRGDGPGSSPGGGPALAASPHTRGWTGVARDQPMLREGFPAHAGMDPSGPSATAWFRGLPRTRGDGPPRLDRQAEGDAASPHTRGWTRPDSGRRPGGGGFPAHAGMDPCNRARSSAPAGLPRTRGDGPEVAACFRVPLVASPHTRGWTRTRQPHRFGRRGFPAHAGMDPFGS